MLLTPFELLQLPKHTRDSRATIPITSEDENLFVGVSSSAINKLSLRPPQVLSAHAVAPGTTITAILISDSSVLAYASLDRGKAYLNLLEQNDETRGTARSKTIEVPEEICALYKSSDGSQIAAVSKNTSRITGFSSSNLEKSWTEPSPEEGTVVYSTTLNASESSMTSFMVLSQQKNSILLRIFSLDSRNLYTLVSTSIQGEQAQSKVASESHFSLFEDTLYQATSSSVYVYRTPDAALLTSFEVNGPANVTGLIALPNNNVAIARDAATIELIDCTFQSLIHSIKLSDKGPIDLLGFSEAASAIVLVQKQNVLLGLPVIPTQGSLLESIGKGSAHKAAQFAFADIFAGFTQPASEYKQTAQNQISAAQEEKNRIISDISDSIKRRDGPSFAEVITYLKNPKLSWQEWHESGEASGPEEQDLVYEESDRNVDRGLIRKISELAFLPRFKPFLPIGVAVYLLTHPLFPVGEPRFENLLRSLEKSDAILYRQALVSLSGVTAKDLVFGLTSLDEATFLEAAVRLQEDYGSQQILQGIKEALGNLRSVSSLSIVIERLSRHQETIGLIGPFIDTIGLLAWDPENIKKLKASLASQIESIETCTHADAAITDLFTAANISIQDAISGTPQNVRDHRRPGSDEDSARIPKYSIETLVL